MLLKGIIMVFIGLSGVAGTIIWFIKDIKKTDVDNKDQFNIVKNQSLYISGAYNTALDRRMTLDDDINSLEYEEADSTVLIDDSAQNREIDETILLEEEDLH